MFGLLSRIRHHLFHVQEASLLLIRNGVNVNKYAISRDKDFGRVEMKVTKVAGNVYMLQGRVGAY